MKQAIYEHIDNGGIGFEISKDKYDITTLELVTMYHGHPYITSNLSGNLSNEFLKKLAYCILGFVEESEKANK